MYPVYLILLVFAELPIFIKSSEQHPTLNGPGFECKQAFEKESLTLESILLCNKTATGPGFNKTEVQTLDTSVLYLDEGDCEQFSGDGFRCIEHYQCLRGSTLITDGNSQTRIVSVVTTVNTYTTVPGASFSYNYSIIDATDKKCETYTKVCCRPGGIGPRIRNDTTDHVFCNEDDESTHPLCNGRPNLPKERPKPPQDFVPKCGRHNPDGYQQSLVNLDEALHESQFAEWPNMCAVIIKNAYACGASLISPNFVISAAHCFNSSAQIQDIIVRCGDWNTAEDTELYPFQERNVEILIPHPKYVADRGDLVNDIAILQVSEKFSLAPHVDTICLPSPGQTFEGSSCAAAGWGKDRFGEEGQLQTIMKEVWLDVLEHKDCEEKLRKTKLGRFFILNETFLCAGGEADIDMCTGDAGSPLMCNVPNGFVQAGIVSWGIGCGQDDIPGVYVDLRKYVCWIKCIVEKVEGAGYFRSLGENGSDYGNYDVRNVDSIECDADYGDYDVRGVDLVC